MERQLQPSALAEWKCGWSLVLASFVGFSFFSIMSASIGIFMEPLNREFGWSRTLLSSGVAIASVTTAVLSPFFGLAIDRFGPRRVAMPGLILTALAISLFATANGSPIQWLLLWTFYAIISISVKTTVWTLAVAGSFTKAQGMALGVTLSGTAAALTIIPPLANWLIGELGWRGAYIALGAGWGLLTYVVCFFFFYDARERLRQQLPRNANAKFEPLQGLSLAAAKWDRALWKIAAAALITMMLSIGLLIHQIPILVEAGLSRTNAAWLAGLAGLAGIAGKLISGALLDRYRANWVGGLTLASTSLAFALLINGIHTPTLIVVAMLVNGYCAGAKLQIASYLTARHAGMRNFGAIYGFMTSVVALGSGLGPMAAGLVYDLSGAYTGFLIAGAIGCLFSGFLVWSLPPYPRFVAEASGLGAPA